MDFVLAHLWKTPWAVECKWSADSFEPGKLRAFRRKHLGDNLVVAHGVNRSFSWAFGDLRVRFESLEAFADQEHA